jgi:uncharacterized protein with NRDE domain
VCLILFAVDAHPQYRLIVAANRDEFFARPTAPAAAWPDADGIVGGRDLEKGGSWLAVKRGGRVAAVTNFRNGSRTRTASRSRGLLVSDFLSSDAPPDAFVELIDAHAAAYDGFNLVIADDSGAWHYSNVERQAARVTAGIHGLSNHLLDTPWPKVERGRAAMAQALAQPRDGIIENLFEALGEERRAEDHDLPSTGIDLEWERVLSSAFIATPAYGTRASTVVLIDRSGAITFIERSFAATPDDTLQERSYELPAQPLSSALP